ncbi:glycoside hydrolase family protein [Pedobacter caeni]|uniref:Lanthionine synthetase C-like protein n=1 Tax=Pedobacter caeni TaxID=288992 RepID=A0A1M5EEG9_9SPHI|nr:hypothetical protein [Pedobacter caeni]SHF77629.1 hypothetical protein SAMN04488522_103618 [Pedobacter caeni]
MKLIKHIDVKLGLADGLAGSILLNFLISHNNGCLKSRERGESQLDKLTDHIDSTEDISFANGLMGIGWLIEFCAQNNLLYINSDQILEDIEDIIYRHTLTKIYCKQIEVDKFLELINYYQIRSLSRNQNEVFYRKMPIFKLLNTLVNRLCKEILIGETHFQNLENKIRIMLKMSYLRSTCMSERLMMNNFYPTMEQTLSFFEENCDEVAIKGQISLSQYYELAVLLSLTIKQFINSSWRMRIEEICVNLAAKFVLIGLNTILESDENIFLNQIYRIPILSEEMLNNIAKSNRSLFICILTNYRLKLIGNLAPSS